MKFSAVATALFAAAPVAAETYFKEQFNDDVSFGCDLGMVVKF